MSSAATHDPVIPPELLAFIRDHTTFYLGRPVEEATADSVAELLAPVVGQRR